MLPDDCTKHETQSYSDYSDALAETGWTFGLLWLEEEACLAAELLDCCLIAVWSGVDW